VRLDIFGPRRPCLDRNRGISAERRQVL
jgi:hypothetical protein